jgi:hypothetical protein
MRVRRHPCDTQLLDSDLKAGGGSGMMIMSYWRLLMLVDLSRVRR